MKKIPRNTSNKTYVKPLSKMYIIQCEFTFVESDNYYAKHMQRKQRIPGLLLLMEVQLHVISSP